MTEGMLTHALQTWCRVQCWILFHVHLDTLHLGVDQCAGAHYLVIYHARRLVRLGTRSQDCPSKSMDALVASLSWQASANKP